VEGKKQGSLASLFPDSRRGPYTSSEGGRERVVDDDEAQAMTPVKQQKIRKCPVSEQLLKRSKPRRCMRKIKATDCFALCGKLGLKDS
jgi:hypothetical protein